TTDITTGTADAVVPPGRPVATSTAFGRRQLGDLDEPDVLDTLHDQLRDPVAAAQTQLVAEVVVDQAHADLAAVPRVDRARGVHDRQPRARRQPGAWVHETGVPGGQGDRNTGADHGPLTGAEHDVRCAGEVDARVVASRVRGHGHRGVDPGRAGVREREAVHGNIDGADHGERRYPRQSCRITPRPPRLRRPAPPRSTSGCPCPGGGTYRPSGSACCSAQRCTWATPGCAPGSATSCSCRCWWVPCWR